MREAGHMWTRKLTYSLLRVFLKLSGSNIRPINVRKVTGSPLFENSQSFVYSPIPYDQMSPLGRIRITKAAEFFKAVIPCMDPNMDKATAFHWTVYYMVFLRNALLKQDPPILPKLHQVFTGLIGYNNSSLITLHSAVVIELDSR